MHGLRIGTERPRSVGSTNPVVAFHELLNSISEPACSQVIREIEVRRYKNGEYLFRQGDVADVLYCVMSGWVKIVLDSADGHQLIVAPLIKPGEIFGEIAVLDGGPRTASAVAGCDACLGLLRRSSLMGMVLAHPESSLAMMRILCRRLRHVSNSVETRVFHSAPSRLAKCLLDLAHRNGVVSRLGIALGVKFSQQDLALMIGATRELVNKLLKCWEREGRVTLFRGRVVELCPAALSELIEEAVIS